VLRGYEVAPNQYVTVKQEELRQLRLPTSPTMEILRTTRLPEIDPLYFETSYYVVPEPIGERAYALLYAALQETNYAALARVAMHGREHIMLVRPGKKGLLAHTLYYNDELRADTEFAPDLTKVLPKELILAKSFVEAIAGPFAPEEFKDTYREQLQELIAGKTARQEIAPAARATVVSTPVVDIMVALTKSLERAKQAAPPRRQPGKATTEKTKRRKA
jgi:DNA end-binding protein Ku